MKNDIFSNPEGWAQKVVGSSLRYRCMQILSLVQGGCLAEILFLLCKEAHLPLVVFVSALVFVVIAAVQLPLCYLRALRFYVVDSQLTRSLHSTPR
jgi:hypothetical protein